MLDLQLHGAHVLVTGGSGGIGVPTVELFIEQGAFVTCQYNTSVTGVNGLVEKYRTRQGLDQVQFLQCDVTDEYAVTKLFERAEERSQKGPVTILVLNHAIYETKSAPIHLLSLAQFRRTMTINLEGSFLVLRAYLKRLSEESKGSRIRSGEEVVSVVMIGSTAGEFGEAGHSDYAASKSALTHGLLLSLKNEIVKISPRARVNCVAPGWVETKMAEESIKNPDLRYQAMATTPLNKIATPKDVANQIVMLASQAVSGHLTGQVVRLHGGMEGRLLNAKPKVDGQ